MDENVKTEEQAASLEDLELAIQQAETKAGTGTHADGGGGGAGKATFQDLSFTDEVTSSKKENLPHALKKLKRMPNCKWLTGPNHLTAAGHRPN